MEGGRSWMYRRLADGWVTDEFQNGVHEFIEHAKSLPEYQNSGVIRCPCRKSKCQNVSFRPLEEVHSHLLRNGFVPGYTTWHFHGEEYFSETYPSGATGGLSEHGEGSGSGTFENADVQNLTRQMIMDAGGPNIFSSGGYTFDGVGAESERVFPSHMEESPNPNAQQMFDMMRSANRPIWEGSTHSQMSVTARMVGLKSEYRMSERCYDGVSELMREAMPPGNCMPKNFYETKKLMKGFGLPVEKIHCCKKGCMIYWGIDKDRESCKICNEDRYEVLDGGRNRPYKQMWYFPLVPRLQRMYASKVTAGDMRWHAEHPQEDGVMNHPSDSQAWKHLNYRHPLFAAESRNVRLGLCTDGFAPFGQYGGTYSSWPIILTPYNLPPWLCMKEQFMFLTVIVPGKKNPKQRIDVYLQPLIAELQQLWSVGVETYDVSRNQNFTMRAALIWTISDFPAYSMLSGWSTQGKLACPYCMEWSDAFYLSNGRKMCWFDNHRKFLPFDHSYRFDVSSFRKDNIVEGCATPYRSGEEILAQIESFGLVRVFDGDGMQTNRRILNRCKDVCGWRKRSIFWDLPYWADLLIRHNLDVMHIEKNVFDNLFNTVMNQEKTKDNAQAREDLKLYCCREELHQTARGEYPMACFGLDRRRKKCICQWLKEISFPDGCASNISRCVDTEMLRLKNMKSHDCHVFMQRLVPVAFRELLPEAVWTAVTGLSVFFRSITCSRLTVPDMCRLESEIPIILCNLERIFPPSFFDSMEHLTVHLPHEARYGGPVQYRWMYPFERFLKRLKNSIGNFAHVEGSIANSYLTDEMNNFCAYYFPPEIPTRHTRVRRNDDGGVPIQANIHGMPLIFCHPARTYGKCKKRYLTPDEMHAAHTTIMLNCDEIKPYQEIYRQQLRAAYDYVTDEQVEQYLSLYFCGWFDQYRQQVGLENDILRDLSFKPLTEVSTYRSCFVNGYKFQVAKKDTSKYSAKNSGVCIKGANSSNHSTDFYGILEDIIVVQYVGSPPKEIVLFKCDWYDPTEGVGTRIHHAYDIVDVNKDKRYRGPYDPFILASHAQQVCYLDYPTLRAGCKWRNVSKVKSSSVVMDILENDTSDPIINAEPAPAFQDDVPVSHSILTVYDGQEQVRPLNNTRGGSIQIVIGDEEAEDEETILTSSEEDEDDFHFENLQLYNNNDDE